MNRLAYAFRPEPKKDADDRFTISADNFAMGLLVFLLGLIFAGIMIAAIYDFATIRKFDWRDISFHCPLAQTGLLLHGTVIRNHQGIDWHGFAVTLVKEDGRRIQLARNKHMEPLRQYADDFRKLTGITIKEINSELPI